MTCLSIGYRILMYMKNWFTVFHVCIIECKVQARICRTLKSDISNLHRSQSISSVNNQKWKSKTAFISTNKKKKQRSERSIEKREEKVFRYPKVVQSWKKCFNQLQENIILTRTRLFSPIKIPVFLFWGSKRKKQKKARKTSILTHVMSDRLPATSTVQT